MMCWVEFSAPRERCFRPRLMTKRLSRIVSCSLSVSACSLRRAALFDDLLARQQSRTLSEAFHF